MISTPLRAIVCALLLTCPSAAARRDADGPEKAQAASHPIACRPDGGRQTVRCQSGMGPAGGPANKARPGSAIADELAACSPFLGIGGDKELDFDAATGAVTETIDEPDGRGGLADPPPIEMTGTFAVNGRTGRIVTAIGGERREYALVVPGDSTQCILALGKAKAVDLEHSWFANPSDEPDAAPPEYQKAAGRV
jgi:hypothetical protein